MTQILVLSLLGYATCGLVLSLAVYLGALAGFQPPGGNVLFGGLHVGIFPLVLALILIFKLRPGTTDVETDNWRLPVFPGSPAWMNYMARGFYIYALNQFCPLLRDEPRVYGNADALHEPLFRCRRSFHRILERLFELVDDALFDRPGHPYERLPGRQMQQRPLDVWRAGQRKF
jgi:hypothetical protein